MGLEVTIQNQKYILIDVCIREPKDQKQLLEAEATYGVIAQSLKYIHIDGGFWGNSVKMLLVSVLIPEQHVLHVVKNVFR